MSPLVSEAFRMGWAPMLQEAMDWVAECRLKIGTNDVVIVAQVEEGGKYVLKSDLREVILSAMQEHLPEAVDTIQKLQAPLPPDRFLVVVFHMKTPLDIYGFDIPLKGTLGVLS